MRKRSIFSRLSRRNSKRPAQKQRFARLETLEDRRLLTFARFIQVIESTPNRFHLGELEAFEFGVAPNGSGGASFGGMATSTNDIADGTATAYNIGNVYPTVGTTASLNHGGGNRDPNNNLESGGAVWSTNIGGQLSQYTLDLGGSFDIGTIRAWPRADGCCTDRWDQLTFNLYEDNGSGMPQLPAVATQVVPDPNANSPHEITFPQGNVAPTLNDLDGDSLSYGIGVGQLILDQATAANVVDADSADFDSGSLTVSFSAGGDATEDELSINDQGSAPGQIGYTSPNVSFGGTQIGTVTGDGPGAGPLVVSLNANATPAAVTALVQNITYLNSESTSPANRNSGSRQVAFTVNDGDGGTSNTANVVLNMDFGGAVDTFVWDNSVGDFDWTNPLNWDLDTVVPDSNDVAVFRTAGGGTVDLGGGTQAVGELRFDGTGNFEISNGTLQTNTIDQQATAMGANEISALVQTVSLSATVSNGSLSMSNGSQSTTLTGGTWTVDGSGDLVSIGPGTFGDADITLQGGDLEFQASTPPVMSRFVRVKNNGGTNRLLHIGEIEAFPLGVLPAANFDNANDLALSSQGATIESTIGGGGHGNQNDTIDGNEQTGAAVWTRQAVGAEIVVDLGASHAVSRVRVHQRNDGCCQNRLSDFTVSLLEDDGFGNPGAVVGSISNPGQPPTNGFGEATFQSVATNNNDILVDSSSTIRLASGLGATTVGSLTIDAGETLTIDSVDPGQAITFSDTLLNGGTATIHLVNGARVDLGSISEAAAANLAFTGSGTVNMVSSSTYTGTTSVGSGVLVQAGNDTAFGTDANGTTVDAGGSVNFSGGNFTETFTVGGIGFGTGSGDGQAEGALTKSSGSNVVLNGLVTLTGDTRVYSAGNQLNFNGGIAVGAHTLTLDAQNRIDIDNTSISGTGLVRVEGNDRVDIQVSNVDFDGDFEVFSDGQLDVHDNDGLGDHNGTTTVTGGEATVYLRNGRTLRSNFVIDGDGRGTAGAIQNVNNTNTIDGSVTLAGDASIVVNTNSTLIVTGSVSGNFMLTKGGAGTLALNNTSHNYSEVDLVGGSLRITHDSGVGNNTTAMTLGAGQTLEADATAGDFTLAKPDTLTFDGGSLNVTAGQVTLDPAMMIDVGITADVNIGGDGDLVVNQSFGNGLNAGPSARFVQIQKAPTAPDALLHVGELEAFLVSAPPVTNIDPTNDIALSSKGASILSASTVGGHGSTAAVIDGAEQSGAAVWTKANGGVGAEPQITVDLGANADIGVIRVHQRNDGCCQARLADFHVRLFDDAGGAPGALVSDMFFSGTAPTNLFAEFTYGGINNLNKTGDGTLTLAGDNNFNGAVNLMGGTIVAAHDNAFGLPGGDVAASTGTTVGFSGDVNVANENISGAAALENVSGTNSYTGDVLADQFATTMTIQSNGGELTLGGTIDLQNSSLHFDGAGDAIVNSDISGNGSGIVAPIARFVQVIESTPSLFHLTELEAFAAGVVPNNAGGASFGGLSTSTNDIADGSATAYNIANVYPAVGTTASLAHGGGNTHPNNNLEGGGSSWTTNIGSQLSQYTLDLGANASVETLRMWPRADGCCTDRWDTLTINLYDDAGGAPGTLTNSIVIPDPNANTPHQVDTRTSTSNAVIKNGSGSVTLTGTNTYDDGTTVVDGTLIVASNDALGTSANVTVQDGGTLGVSGGTTIAGKDIVLNGTGAVGRAGALVNISGDNVIANTSSVTAELVSLGEIGIASEADSLTIDATVDLALSRLVVDGAGDLVITGDVTGNGVDQPVGVSARFIQIQKDASDPEALLHVGELEAFLFGATLPPAPSFDNVDDLALSSKGASILTASGGGGHGNPADVIDGNEQSGAAVWTRNNGGLGQEPEVTVDLGGTFPIGTVRVHQRNDGCCQQRLRNFWVRLFADAGGSPGALLAQDNFAGQAPTNSFAELMFSDTAFVNNELIKNGTGTLTLAGNNDYNNGTTISAGLVLATNTAGSATGPGNVVVEAGAVLGGTGSIDGMVDVQMDGSLSPGNNVVPEDTVLDPFVPGTLTLTGTVNMQSGSNFLVEVEHSVGHDVLDIDGTLNVDPAANLVIYTNGEDPTSQYIVVDVDDTTGSVAGTFAVDPPNPASPTHPLGTVSRDDGEIFTVVDYAASLGVSANDIALDGDDEVPTATLDPANGLLGLGTSQTTFTVTFDEPVQVDTDNPMGWEVELYHDTCGVSAAPVATLTLNASMLALGDTQLQLDFSAQYPTGLDEGEYWINLPTGAIEDQSFAQNPFAGLTSPAEWSFNTSNNTGALGAGVLNEILFNPQDGDHGREYIELRGDALSEICPNVHLLAVSGEGANAGQIEHIFNLGGLTFGSNGFLVLTQANHPYAAAIAPGANVVTAGGGDGWTDTDHSDNFSHEGPINLKNTSTSFLMVRSTAGDPPMLGQQIGLADGTLNAPAQWNVAGDSIAFVDRDADIAYGNFVFHNNSIDPNTQIPTGDRQQVIFTPAYVGRNGDTTGTKSEPAWLAGGVAGTAPDYSLDATDATARAGERLNHIGSSNFALPIELILTGGSNDVTEGLGIDTFDLFIDSTPNDVVNVSLDGGGQLQFAPGNNAFSNTLNTTLSAGSNVIQVRAVDDLLSEGPHSGTIDISTSSNDPRFDGLSLQTTATIQDNDPVVGDLIVRDVIIHAVENNSLTLSFTVENTGVADVDLNGPTPAASDNVNFEAYTGNNDVHDDLGDVFAFRSILGQSPLPILSTGDTYTTTRTFNNLDLNLDQRPTLTLAIDSENVITEGVGEDNNTSAHAIEAQPTFRFDTPADVFSGTPGSTIPVTLTAQGFVGDMVGFQLDFANSSPELQLDNWTTNQVSFPFTLDGNLDSGTGDTLVGASAFNAQHPAGTVLGTFDVTLPNTPGTYTLSLSQTAGVGGTALTDPNNDPIPVFFFGDIEVISSNDTQAPTATLSNPLNGVSTTVDLGYVDIQLADDGPNPTGIAVGTIHTSNIVIAGGAVTVDDVQDMGSGVWRYVYNIDGDTLPDTNPAGDGTVITVQVLDDPTQHPDYNPATPDEFQVIRDGAGNTVVGQTSSFTYDATLPSVQTVTVNATQVDPADRDIGPQPTSWLLQRSDIRDIQIIFSEDVSLDASNISLTNLGIDPDNDADTAINIAADQVTVVGNTVTIEFATDDLDSGVYQLDIVGATDALGNVMAPYSLRGTTAEPRLYEFQGDWNGDNRVTIFDFNTLAYWFGIPGPEYIDLNGDGGISIFDFAPFRLQFAQGLVVEQAPEAVADTVMLNTDEFDFAIDVLANDLPVGGLTILSVTASGTNPNADIWVDTINNVIGYESADVESGWTGTDTFTYTVEDANGVQATGTVEVIITPPVPRPVLADNGTESQDDLLDLDGGGDSLEDLLDDLADDIAGRWNQG